MRRKWMMVVGAALVGTMTFGNYAMAEEAEAIKIGVSVADQSNVFYVDIVDGMESAVKEGDELIVVDAGFDAAKQLNDIDDMIQQGVK